MRQNVKRLHPQRLATKAPISKILREKMKYGRKEVFRLKSGSQNPANTERQDPRAFGGAEMGYAVRNDWDDDMGLLSNEELEREVARLKEANQVLRQKLDDVSKIQSGPTDEAGSSVDIESGPLLLSHPGQSKATQVGALAANLPPLAERDCHQCLRMNIVYVSAEVAPWSKTGSLGDAARLLPVALAKLGHRVMVVAPRYLNGVTDGLYDCARDMHCQLPLEFGDHLDTAVKYFHYASKGVDWVFVDHPCFHRRGGPYGDTRGTYGDNISRFAILNKAACEAPLHLHLLDPEVGECRLYGETVQFIANDWHAGLVPVYVRDVYQAGVFNTAKCVLAIHNLVHQGVEGHAIFRQLGLPNSSLCSLEWSADEGHRSINIMKGAITTADQIVTASSIHGWDISSKERPMGLAALLASRADSVHGIMNGIDTEEWNPEADKFIEFRYSSSNSTGKLQCKLSLQKELGFEQSSKIPLIGFVGRLDHQKDLDIILDAINFQELEGCQFVVLGSGDMLHAARMKEVEKENRKSFRGWAGYSVPVSHRIMAGCDMLLISSDFESCGLALCAMRYGTVPVVRDTGGLLESVDEFNPFASKEYSSGTGFNFSDPTPGNMLEAIKSTVSTFREDKERWRFLCKGMSLDFSWSKAAEQYVNVLRRVQAAD